MISTIVKMQPTIERPASTLYDIFQRPYTVEGGKKRASEAVGDDDIRRTTLVLAPASLLQQV